MDLRTSRAILSFICAWTVVLQVLHVVAESDGCTETVNETNGSVFSVEEINAILDAHNELRRNVTPPAKVMPMLRWNSNLGVGAQSYVGSCPGRHHSNISIRTNVSGFEFVGENMAGGVPLSLNGVRDIVSMWGYEKNFFTYQSVCQPNAMCGICNPSGMYGTCGHYTQIIWGGTTDVGCGFQYCVNDTYQTYYYYTCWYGFTGNILGVSPYTTGPPPYAQCQIAPPTTTTSEPTTETDSTTITTTATEQLTSTVPSTTTEQTTTTTVLPTSPTTGLPSTTSEPFTTIEPSETTPEPSQTSATTSVTTSTVAPNVTGNAPRDDDSNAAMPLVIILVLIFLSVAVAGIILEVRRRKRTGSSEDTEMQSRLLGATRRSSEDARSAQRSLEQTLETAQEVALAATTSCLPIQPDQPEPRLIHEETPSSQVRPIRSADTASPLSQAQRMRSNSEMMSHTFDSIILPPADESSPEDYQEAVEDDPQVIAENEEGNDAAQFNPFLVDTGIGEEDEQEFEI